MVREGVDMSIDDQVKRPRRSDRAAHRGRRARPHGLPAIGLEAEFATIVDDVQVRPEDVFVSPRRIVRGPLVHRTGRSYHLPTGGAVYFDTGVIELATPMIEIERGCGARGTRALWESLGFLREELDDWERRRGRSVRLVGFSTHYNVTFDVPADESTSGRTVERLAYLLTHLLAAPVMLLAANRRSTGIGVRPRGDRIEVTADFTPDAGLMAATATLIVGIVREVMAWPSYDLGELARRGIPVVQGFHPVVHSSRQGWVARHACFPSNPFTCDVNAAVWTTTTGRRLSLREMAGRTTRAFWSSIRSLGDPLSLQLIAAVMRGRAPSLLELPDRPAAYDDVGRLCRWNDLFPITLLPRSRFERVLGHAIAGRRVRMDGYWHRPIGVRGWTHVVFRRECDGVRRVISLDQMLAHLDAWDRTADRRMSQRRIAALARRELERRMLADRRARLAEVEHQRRASDQAEALLDTTAAKPDEPPIDAPSPDAARVARADSEVPVPRSTKSRADPPPTRLAVWRVPSPTDSPPNPLEKGSARAREAAPPSAEHHPSRHAH
jgi:hypothetical protein